MATKTREKKASRKPSKSAPISRKPVTIRSDRPRRLHLPAPRLFRLKRIKYPEKLPSAWKLLRTTAAILWRNKWLYLGIVLVYALLDIVFVRGISNGFDISAVKDQLTFGTSGAAQVGTSLLVLTTLFTSSGSDSGASGSAYQLVLGIIISLATIWATRQIAAGKRVGIKQAFYQGMYPLVPFVLVLFMIVLQLVPLFVGATLFSVVVGNGIAATGLEQAIAGAIFAVLALTSIYMICSSLFALYIVTLPDMTPRKALKSARQLVQYRRGQVFRRLLYVPVVAILLLAALMIPAIIFIAPAATWLFFGLSMLGLVAVNVYMYSLYKALLA